MPNRNSRNNQSDSNTDSGLEHAWRYFELHATQRLTAFNFFLILSAAVSAGMAAAMQGSPRFAILGVALGLLLVLAAYVFWKLDQRTSFLIKHSEKYISSIETNCLPDDERIFSSEPEHFSSHRSTNGFWHRAWTYGRCFRTVFAVMAAVGAAGAIISSMIFLGAMSWSTPSTNVAPAASQVSVPGGNPEAPASK